MTSSQNFAAIAPAKLRRLALDRQGLLRRVPFGRGPGAVLRAIEQLGYVQIDTISVVERAHHHVLATRVPGYRTTQLDSLLARGKVFEYWYHAAAYLPMRDYRFALPRMQAMRRGEGRWQRSRDRRLMRYVLDRVTAEGPLKARDFEAPARTAADEPGWWNWKPAKAALEQLFMQGDLMAVRRDGFQKVYDLRERVLPSHVDTRTPTLAEQAAHLIDNTLQAHGFADVRSMTHLRPGEPLRRAVRQNLQVRLDQGSVTAVLLPAGAPAYALSELLDQRAPPASARVRILSPFDNAVILRHRGTALYAFDYQIECYVPAERRRYGYFSLPLLYGDRFVGRADCKAHRDTGCLEVKSLHLQDPPGAALAAALAAALLEFAGFNGCSHITLGLVQPAAFESLLQTALAQTGPSTQQRTETIS